MPKVVDHDERRREIVTAATQLLVESGWSAVTLRGVAARTRASTGSVRHYLPDQHSLRAAVALGVAERLRTRVAERIAVARTTTPASDQVVAVLCELLPLDDERRDEYALWSALVAWERDQPPARQSSIWADQRELHRRCVAQLTGTQVPAPPQTVELGPSQERWAAYLHVLVDGLAAQMVQTPDHADRRTALQLLRGFVDEIRTGAGTQDADAS